MVCPSVQPDPNLWTAALKFFRACIGLQDEFYNRQITQNHLFEPILNIVYDTMPRDNLLNSACLELFEFIKRENIKPIILHVVENYRERLQEITYVDTFQNLILRYDQMQGFNADIDTTLFGPEAEGPSNRIKVNGNQRWQGVKEMDATEEEYFNTSDDEDDASNKRKNLATPSSNGASPLSKPLVDYPDDDEDAMDIKTPSSELGTPGTPQEVKSLDGTPETPSPKDPTPTTQTPPERLSEKRRREEDEEDDELGKLSLTKRRSSSVSSAATANSTSSNILRRKKSFTNNRDSPTSKKIEISLGVKALGDADHKRDNGG